MVIYRLRYALFSFMHSIVENLLIGVRGRSRSMILLGPCDSYSYLLLYADSVLSQYILDLLQGIRRPELRLS
uniref:Putative ovule protein n=1 Tax=Solanum chacoense TaxID=4108 RepID=A0A0V0HLW3_SOLCH